MGGQRAQPPLAQMRDRGVDRDPVQPGAGGRGRLVPRPGPVGLREAVLCDVLGLRGVEHDRSYRTVDIRVLALVEEGKLGARIQVGLLRALMLDHLMTTLAAYRPCGA